MDTNKLLDPARIEVIGRIMQRYGQHLEDGDRVRVGIEGDTCSTFRSAGDAPEGTVKNLSRGENGLLSFDLEMDGSGELKRFTNRSFDPNEIWEVSPSYLDTFKAKLFRGTAVSQPVVVSDDGLTKRVEELSEKLSTFMQTMSERVATVEETQNQFRGTDESVWSQLAEIKESEQTFRSTMAEMVRAVAGDTLRLAQGQPIEFGHIYADRFDKAQVKDDGVFKGAEKPKLVNQNAKFDFTPGEAVTIHPVPDSSEPVVS